MRHLPLHKDRAHSRIETGRQKIQRNLANVFQPRCVGIAGRQRVLVGNKEVALILVLQLHPVMQRAHVVAKVQLARRTHPAQDTRTWSLGSVICH